MITQHDHSQGFDSFLLIYPAKTINFGVFQDFFPWFNGFLLSQLSDIHGFLPHLGLTHLSKAPRNQLVLGRPILPVWRNAVGHEPGQGVTPPETNSKKHLNMDGWNMLEHYFPIGKAYFQGLLLLVSGRVFQIYNMTEKCEHQHVSS